MRLRLKEGDEYKFSGRVQAYTAVNAIEIFFLISNDLNYEMIRGAARTITDSPVFLMYTLPHEHGVYTPLEHWDKKSSIDDRGYSGGRYKNGSQAVFL